MKRGDFSFSLFSSIYSFVAYNYFVPTTPCLAPDPVENNKKSPDIDTNKTNGHDATSYETFLQDCTESREEDAAAAAILCALSMASTRSVENCANDVQGVSNMLSNSMEDSH